MESNNIKQGAKLLFNMVDVYATEHKDDAGFEVDEKHEFIGDYERRLEKLYNALADFIDD